MFETRNRRFRKGEEMKWISAKDRLPEFIKKEMVSKKRNEYFETSDFVLATCGNKKNTYVAYTEHSHFFIQCKNHKTGECYLKERNTYRWMENAVETGDYYDSQYEIEPTYWMPIPELPKKEKK